MSTIIILLSTTILITGCTQSSSTEKYKVGTDGLVIEFSKSNPTSIYEREEFGTSLFIKNVGSYDIDKNNPAKLKVLYDNYRITSKISSGNVEVPDIVLAGKSQYFPAGSESPVEFYFESNSLTQLRESATTTINYNLCYPYATEFTTMTCIDTKTANKADVAVACTSEVYNGGAGQGAPIVVTKIEPEIMLQENYIMPQYKIYIENMGGGYVTSQDTCDVADISTFTDKYNEFSGRVKVYATLSGEKLDCGPDKSGLLRLVDSNSYITCYLSKTANQNKYSRTNKNYISPLTIDVEYTYVTLEKQDIEIKRNDLVVPDVAQGLCLSYQVEYNGQCMDKCEYCSTKNPSDIICQQNKPYPGFVFRDDFSCACSLQQCDLKESKGSCIKGYCNGDRYCCSTLDCDQWQVEYNGQCIDKCKYCAEINSSDTQICGDKADNGIDFTGFTCESISEATCKSYQPNGYCITGFCGGENKDKYCANSQNAAKMQQVVDLYDQKGMNLCTYCSSKSVNGADDICKFTNNGIGGKINSDFGCYCVESDVKKFPGYAIDPERGHCYVGPNGPYNYCCNTQYNPGNN